MNLPWRIRINEHISSKTWGWITNVSRSLYDILSKYVCCKNRTSDENFKLKLCARAQIHALGTRTTFHSVNNCSEPQDRSTTQLPSSTVHAWEVTEWSLQWKPIIEDFSNFIDIWMDFFVDFRCARQMIFWKWMKKLLLVLEPPFRDRKSLGTKQTQVKPNVNRCWPIRLVNYIQPQLSRLGLKSSRIPASQNAVRATPYGGFQRFAA